MVLAGSVEVDGEQIIILSYSLLGDCMHILPKYSLEFVAASFLCPWRSPKHPLCLFAIHVILLRDFI